ncbi:hypothetical protein BC938DRAFT_479336 [Jimgerdemannia flammicorona]|uniref:DUF7886 domain-containing protein n=1 Tax=Jimgerdemannia flammicorona TaxID=994334 RepID=A0A433QXV7_9FUNG|nr:hypothetical protein BC938DRAFT_479336 [Jimgerdemannia flammicorona]
MTNSPEITPPTPISPIDKELQRDEEKTAFLIAGYARYKCPYVWLRSNHRKLVQLPDNEELDADIPLKLDTTALWKTQDIRLWDIIAEIITLTLTPSPPNPFEVDTYYFETLPLEECVTTTGAMIDFLQRVWVNAKEDCNYGNRVLEDVKNLQIRHFNAFEELHELAVAHRDNMVKAGSPVVEGGMGFGHRPRPPPLSVNAERIQLGILDLSLRKGVSGSRPQKLKV